MANSSTTGSSNARQYTSSPRGKGRDFSKNTLCRNVKIYGYCSQQSDGCMYAHDVTSLNNRPQPDDVGQKKKLNVDSPAFTPVVLDTPSTINITNSNMNSTNSNNGVSAGPSFAQRANPISPKAAIAAPFMPKVGRSGIATPPMHGGHQHHQHQHHTPSQPEWPNHEVAEFVPQNFQNLSIVDQGAGTLSSETFNPYADPSATSYVNLDGTTQTQQLNPYATDMGAAGASTFYQSQNAFSQPLQYHLYAPMAPHHENLLTYQRTVHDFFIPENLRQDLQRKADATLQTLPNSNLPPNIEHFHSLVPLDTTNQKSNASFGYNSWLYKATSSKDGQAYVLRRIEGFRLTNEKAVRSIQSWKRVNNGGVVTIHDCFTTRAFGDSSMVFVGDYHALSKTMAEQYLLSPANMNRGRPQNMLVPEQVLWTYIVQIASALKAIHSIGLVARILSPSKIIITNKNRIRLSGCGILDVVQPNEGRDLAVLQQGDLQQLGQLIFTLATGIPKGSTNSKSVDSVPRSYSARLRECITTLIETPRDIDTFLMSIADQLTTSFDNAMHLEDTLFSNLSRELENGRLVRLVTKLGFINERPEASETTSGPNHMSNSWSETGERYYLKLFRDYVFHQVNADGRPVVDLGHVITCLNKLDAGSDEKITLVARDEQTVLIVTYKEIKRGLENAFQELLKMNRRN